MKTYQDVVKAAIDGRIYCYCVYAWKDNLKKLGFRWSPGLKLWYIHIYDFTEDIYNKTQEIRFTNNTTIGNLDYYYVYYMSKTDIEERAKNPTVTQTKKNDFSTYAF